MGASLNVPMLMSPLLSRSVFVLGSGMAHVAVLASLAAGPLAEHGTTTAVAERFVSIEIEEAPEPKIVPNETAEPAPARRAPRPASHQHPYPVPASHEAAPHDPRHDHRGSVPSPTHEEGAAGVDSPPLERLDLPRFAISVGPAIARGSATAGALATPHNAAAGGELVEEATVSVPARLIASAPASYPAEAREAEIEATVPLEIVVDTGGIVTSARSLSKRGFGLDEAALSAVRRYRFSPAQKDGRPVRVRMRWTVDFRLR